ncbi:MAG TPA: hypothetical protein VG075_04100 [Candidatus Acidoferrum sp.]|nr:hypothetical protein [Candidatus Acidoferrum sp.]
MKLIRFLMVVAFLGVAATAAFADGVPTDPTLLTSGCGRLGQPKCDAYLITSQFEVLDVVLTLDTTAGDPFFGDAVADFVNVSGHTLDGLFTINFTVPAGLSFQGCGTPPEGITTLFTCTGGGSPDSPITGGGTALFNLTGASICSVDSDDLGGGEGTPITYVSDSDEDDNCQAAFILALKPVAGETLPPTIDATFTVAPEPSSGLLLVFGLAAGLLVLKGLRPNLA